MPCLAVYGMAPVTGGVAYDRIDSHHWLKWVRSAKQWSMPLWVNSDRAVLFSSEIAGWLVSMISHPPRSIWMAPVKGGIANDRIDVRFWLKQANKVHNHLWMPWLSASVNEGIIPAKLQVDCNVWKVHPHTPLKLKKLNQPHNKCGAGHRWRQPWLDWCKPSAGTGADSPEAALCHCRRCPWIYSLKSWWYKETCNNSTSRKIKVAPVIGGVDHDRIDKPHWPERARTAQRRCYAIDGGAHEFTV